MKASEIFHNGASRRRAKRFLWHAAGQACNIRRSAEDWLDTFACLTRTISKGIAQPPCQDNMIDRRIEQIQSTIESTPNIPPDRKEQLLKLVSQLKAEVTTLAETHQDAASSIARFADASAHEAARSARNPELADTALQGLRQSIAGLEESHPVIVQVVNRFATALSNMGL